MILSGGQIQRRMSWGTRLLVVLCGFFVLPLSLFSSPKEQAGSLSPYTAVQFHEGTVRVQFEGRFYELISVNDLPTKKLLDYCKKEYGKLAQQRVAEDLVQVHTQTEYVIPRAPMTHANHKAVKDARTTPKSRLAFEKYIKFALAGELEKAREVSLPKGSGGRSTAWRKADDFQEWFGGKKLRVVDVYADDQRAIAVTSECVHSSKQGFLLLTAVKIEDKWLVDFMEYDNAVKTKRDLGEFLKGRPEAKRRFSGPSVFEKP